MQGHAASSATDHKPFSIHPQKATGIRASFPARHEYSCPPMPDFRGFGDGGSKRAVGRLIAGKKPFILF
jgi:hypothetical protein